MKSSGAGERTKQDDEDQLRHSPVDERGGETESFTDGLRQQLFPKFLTYTGLGETHQELCSRTLPLSYIGSSPAERFTKYYFGSPFLEIPQVLTILLSSYSNSSTNREYDTFSRHVCDQFPRDWLIEAEWRMYTSVIQRTIISSDNGLSLGWCQAIIWTKAGILLIGPSETNFSEISIVIHTFSSKKMRLNYRLQNGGHFVFCVKWYRGNVEFWNIPLSLGQPNSFPLTTPELRRRVAWWCQHWYDSDPIMDDYNKFIVTGILRRIFLIGIYFAER